MRESERICTAFCPDAFVLPRTLTRGAAPTRPGAHAREIKRAFLRSIRDIARACGSRVIAEGIETAAELEVVRSLGIDYGQGYLIGRPSAAPPTAVASAGSAVPAARQGCRL